MSYADTFDVSQVQRNNFSGHLIEGNVHAYILELHYFYSFSGDNNLHLNIT